MQRRSVFEKIADRLKEADFNRTVEQCRVKVKKLKGDYRKVKDTQKTGRFGSILEPWMTS